MIQHGGVACLFYFLTESQHQGGALFHGNQVHSSLGVIHLLHIYHNRTVQTIRFNLVKHKRYFLVYLLLCGCLAEEVHTDLDSCLGGSLNICIELLILHQLAGFSIPTEAHANNCELHTVLRHLIPFDFTLVAGHIDSLVRGNGSISQITEFTAVQNLQILLRIFIHFQVSIDRYKVISPSTCNNDLVGIQIAQGVQCGSSLGKGVSDD